MAEAQEVGRADRRRARTRAALIGAAQRILAERGSTEVAVLDITDEADVGLGSFYNHFTTKAELFDEAVLDLLSDFGATLDEICAGMDDPAEVVAVGIRSTCRLAGSRPEVARILALSGPRFLIADRGLAPQALRDIRRGAEKGRFAVPNPRLALALLAGSVLAYLQMRLSGNQLTDDDADDLAATVLTALGVPAQSAADVAHRSLPVLAAHREPTNGGELP